MENIKNVMVKYIKNGKEIVKYNILTGECWVEQHKGNDIIISKKFSIKKD